MIGEISLEEWAWQVTADTYRVNLYGQLTGRTTPPRLRLLSRPADTMRNQARGPLVEADLLVKMG